MNDERPKVAIYTRVSTEDQAKEGFSLSAQIERLNSYCEAREWEVYREYVDDGYSGRGVKRPAYQQMMEEIDAWDILLVLKMDRIHRNSKNFMEMMDTLKRKNKEFVSMSESLDTSTAMGRFVMDIIQRIAQLESEQIGERVFAGMQQKAQTPIERLDPKRSPYLGFNAPFGYDYDNNLLVINDAEANFVKEIFSSFIGGESITKIAQNLNKRGIKTKRGKEWTLWSIKYVLQNPVYAGFVRWNGHIKKGPHEAIIDKNTFDLAQQKLEDKRVKNGPSL
ncbi:MAG: recombinase family protein [Deltaproteobacteria bacterium]|nr:recombinase family protein [Deltaproteobacteria bacterium]